MNEERPLKIWGQPDEDVQELEGKAEGFTETEAADSDGGKVPVQGEREIVLTDLQDTAEKGGLFRKKREKKQKKSYKEAISELKQMDSKERFDYIKEGSASTKESFVKGTEAAMQSEVGQRAKGFGAQLQRFLKTYRGRQLVTAGIVLVIALIVGINWMKGADLRTGVKLCEQGSYVDAQVPLKNAVEKDNMNPKTYNMLGMAFLGSGEYEDALKQFQLAQNLDPDNQDAWRGLGITYFFTEQYAEAVDALDKALNECRMNVNNTEYDIMWYRAAAETAMRDYEAAEYTYNALLELEGDQAPIYYYRGDIYCRMNEKEKAIADFDKAVSLEGNGYDLYFDIYNSLQEQGWVKEAEGYISQCKTPDAVDTSKMSSTDLSLYQGMILYLEGSYKAAVEQLSVQELKEDYKALTYKALAYEGLKEYKHALTTYKSILKLYPNVAESYNSIALYMMRRGKEKTAVSYLEKGVNSCPAADRKVLYYNMVTAYEQKGDYKGAQDALRQYGVLYGQSKIRHENFYAKERDRS